MPNITTLTDIRTLIPYLPDGVTAALEGLGRWLPPQVKTADSLSLYAASDLTTTAVAVKGSAGAPGPLVIITQSVGTAGFVVIYNIAAASVTVGTSAFIYAHPVSATNNEVTCSSYFGSVGTIFDTAIAVSAHTTARGNTAMTNLPKVWVLYA